MTEHEPAQDGKLAGAAHGKVILLGEHAVVYGHAALCGALRDGVEVRAVAGDGALAIPAWGKQVGPGGDPADPLSQAYGAIVAALLPSQPTDRSTGWPKGRIGHDFVARFAIPTRAGLGSSGALAVAVARAINTTLGLGVSDPRIAAAALAAEQVFHGQPSGLDHTVAGQGGFGLFRREQGLVPVVAETVPLCIGLTGRERDTRGRVERVAQLHRERPGEIGGHFARIAGLVQAGAQAVTAGDLVVLGEAMNDNQEVLGSLEVSCPEIETMCRIARSAGALGAKLTGGGGGGCVIALAPGREERVQAAWRAAGFASFVTTVGGRA